MKTRVLGILLLVSLWAGVAAAQDITNQVQPPAPKNGMFAFSIRGGSYLPLIDDEASLQGAHPYADTFGARMLLMEIQAERYFFRKYGSLGVGFSIGYAEKYANAKDGAGKETAVKTSLQVIPMRVSLVYHLDYAAFRWGFPLIPYGRLGLVYVPWIANNGGTQEDIGGAKGSGGRAGFNVTGGLSFMLDGLDRRLARDFDTDLGVKHSYLFAEYSSDEVTSFGRPGLDLSSRTFMFGLTMDF